MQENIEINIFKRKGEIFPDYFQFELNKELVKGIKDLINNKGYNKKLQKAIIYSFKEKREIISQQRVSYKSHFRDEELEQIINQKILVLIKSILKDRYLNYSFDVEIGFQSFDYILYEIDGYFERHRDFIRINNCYHQQYTFLLGLSEGEKYRGGRTILWYPVDKEGLNDLETIQKTEDYHTLFNLFRKLDIPFYSKDNLYERREEILKENENEEIKMLPKCFDTLKKGQGLIFKSDILHSGERMYSYEKPKELLMITINLTGIPKFVKIMDKFEDKFKNEDSFLLFDNYNPVMLKTLKDNLIPFQIIISKGEYNDKKFDYKFLRYNNFNRELKSIQDNQDDLLKNLSKTLIDIYDETKLKLNTKHREYHISSQVLEKEEKISPSLNELKDISFPNFKNFEKLSYYQEMIDSYFNNFYYLFEDKELEKVKRIEKVNNTWEESGCNDDGDTYDEITYLNCKIKILFGFFNPKGC